MKLHFSLLLLSLSVISCGTRTPVDIPATSDSLVYMGRTVITPGGAVAFNYPGTAVMLNFDGEALEMLTSPDSGYWVVEIDSLPPVKKHFPGDSVIPVADGLPAGPHTARITYCMEGWERHPEIRGLRLPGGGRLLAPPGRPDLRIEFIGNSITCGYGIEADSTEHYSYDTQNFCITYAALTARELDADINVTARSGIGMYRNYNGPREGNDRETMPLEYGHTLYGDTLAWDYNRFIPDIICINLGTNDVSTRNYDIGCFGRAYSAFLDRIRGYYPQAKIVLLSGPMLHGRELDDVTETLDRLAEGREGVYRLDFTPEDGSQGYGADRHPSAGRHRVMAEELTKFLKDSVL